MFSYMFVHDFKTSKMDILQQTLSDHRPNPAFAFSKIKLFHVGPMYLALRKPRRSGPRSYFGHATCPGTCWHAHFRHENGNVANVIVESSYRFWRPKHGALLRDYGLMKHSNVTNGFCWHSWMILFLCFPSFLFFSCSFVQQFDLITEGFWLLPEEM